MGVPEDDKKQDTENILKEIVTENFPHLVKEIDLQVQEAHRTPNKRNPKRTTPRHIIIKIPRAKDKERILKAAREKQLTTGEHPYDCQLISQQKLCKMMNNKNLQPRLLYPAKLSFRIEGQIKSFTDKKKLKECIITQAVLHEILKGIFKKRKDKRKKKTKRKKRKRKKYEQ